MAQQARRSQVVATDSALTKINPIRIESVLSRLPFHALARHGADDIRIIEKDPDGRVTLQWEVFHNSKFGRPGPLAYKVDTLVINRAIDETGRPVPKMLPLGSLRNICRQLGYSSDTRVIRSALRQNASAWVVVKHKYRDVRGEVQKLEAEFSRYSIVFKGEKLPDGADADQVYLIMNDVYLSVLNNVPHRPLDYDYLRRLDPAAQRFYEILSYRVFAALASEAANPVAKIRYSEYCKYSGQRRSPKYDNVRPQVADLANPHIASGYFTEVKLVPIRAENLKTPDWTIMCTPGPKARAEYELFRRKRLIGPEVSPLVLDESQSSTSEQSFSAAELVNYFHMRAHGVSGAMGAGGKELRFAQDLLREYGVDTSRFLVEYAVRESAKTDFQMATLCAARQYVPRGLAVKEAAKQHSATKAVVDRELQEELQYQEQWETAQSRAQEHLQTMDPNSRNQLYEQAKRDLTEYTRGRRYSFVAADLERLIEARMVHKLTHRILTGGRSVEAIDWSGS